MIIKLNGIALEPTEFVNPPSIMDLISQHGSDLAVNATLHAIGHFVNSLNGAFVSILPEVTTILVVACLAIGMFGNFGKWFARAALFLMGGSIWIALSKSLGV